MKASRAGTDLGKLRVCRQNRSTSRQGGDVDVIQLAISAESELLIRNEKLALAIYVNRF